MSKLLNSKSFLIISLSLLSTVIIGCNRATSNNKASQETGNANNQEAYTAIPAVSLNNSVENTDETLIVATELINRQQGKEALAKLQGLEEKYPLITPYILLKQAKAYELEKNNQQATAVLQNILKEYPTSPASAEALYILGKANPKYWQQAIAQFPAHPRTQEIIRQQLSINPNQPRLMATLIKYNPGEPGIDKLIERLVSGYANQLTAEDWAAIADSYWLQWDYGKAGKAYAKAPVTARNLYRAARGYDLGKDKQLAKQYYLKLIQQFPDESDTGLGLRRLAVLVEKKEGLKYLDLAIQKFPTQAPAALLEKAEILDTLKSPESANKARQTLLIDYQDSETAAEYRWYVATQKAKKGELVTAWQWAQPIVINNPNSAIAPKAGFWIGKWAEKLNRPEDATTAYQSVLSRFPRSYYAWRSAVALGWNVGDFTTVRNQTPQVIKASRITPPGGSPIFQNLYKLGLESDAWAHFRTEISDKTSLTVAEEFTLSLWKLYQGKNLQGINKIWDLQNRDTPEDQQQWQQLRQTPEYWQALFPFPFEETILKWSQQRQLNPLLVTALIRQESRFEPEIESSAGALGLMQVMPPTAKNVAQEIGLTQYSLTNPEDNINIGTYYLNFTHQKYNNNSMLAVASYNAGPNAVEKWVSRYGLADVDQFVEQIPYRETKGYVESVFENYWNYMLIYNPEVGKLFESLRV
ncbi:lytic transglycosylase [Chondrocystis sp. NIES-4102]|nr:lytic transglycosylase [Chondrocystis sp. NIES-4102]